MGHWQELAALIWSRCGCHKEPIEPEGSSGPAGRLSRREFLAVGAGMAAGGGLWPSVMEDLNALVPSEGHVEPHQGEALPLEFFFNPNRRVPDPSMLDHTRLFLTFDDGPLACTGHILDLLAATGNKATFFAIGRNLATKNLRAFAVRALKEGHDLGNHSYTHPDFATISAKRAKEEIVATYNLIQEIVEEAGADPRRQNLFFRFPYGSAGSRANRKATEELLAELNYATAWWDVDTNDWRMELAWFPRPFSQVLASFKHAGPSDVVLLHDRNTTARHLPEMLKNLETRHFVSAPLSQYELGLAPEQQQKGPGENTVPNDAPPVQDSDAIAAELLKSILPRNNSTVVSRGIFSERVYSGSKHW
jgi:peptidoglycan-N-acetylglucosamine deacetylase